MEEDRRFVLPTRSEMEKMWVKTNKFTRKEVKLWWSGNQEWLGGVGALGKVELCINVIEDGKRNDKEVSCYSIGKCDESCMCICSTKWRNNGIEIKS